MFYQSNYSLQNEHRNYQYQKFLYTWSTMRDVREGDREVKRQRELYLKRLKGQTDDEYDAYLDRTWVYGAFEKSIDGMVGLAMRKPILISAPDSMEMIIHDIDQQGSDVSAYIKMILSQILEVGRCATLLEYPMVADGATLADVQDARPYWKEYWAEEIIDWEYKNGKLVYCVLREYIHKRGFSYQTNSSQYEYRTLELKPMNGMEGGMPVYHQTIARGHAQQEEVTIIPRMNGKPMEFIPCIIHQTNNQEEITKPPLESLANLCLNWYRLNADHMHALHYVALPTPYIIGVSPEEAPKTIGPEQIWVISNSDAEVGMLEVSGPGIEHIENKLKAIEEKMSVIGSRILVPGISENTATASVLSSLSETSDLAAIFRVIIKQMQQLLMWTAQWHGSIEETNIEADFNFLPKNLESGEIAAVVHAWLSGAIDHQALITIFKHAELINPERSFEDILTEVMKEEEHRMLKAAEMMQMEPNEPSGNGSTEEPPASEG